MRSLHRILFATFLLLQACDSPTAHRESHILSLSIDSAGPLTRTAVVRLDRAAPVQLTWGAPGIQTLTLDINSSSAEHRVTLPRLRAGRDYHVEAATRGSNEFISTSFRTGDLPSEVAALDFSATGTPTAPVVLIEIVAGAGFLGAVMVEEGEVVWYQPTIGSLFGTTRRANGEIVLLTASLGLVSYRIDGTIAHRLPQADSAPGAAYGRIHHDVIATPQNTLLFIANETRVVDGEEVIGEAIWEWTPETGAVVKRWSAFDHLDWRTERGPRSVAGNWLHGNGLALGPRGNVLFSMRNMDQVLSIAPDFSRVEWRVGGAGATIQLDSADVFHGQHGISEPSPGHLLLFDNGWEREGERYSRVLELRIDTGADRASRVWQYRHSPDIYAALVGSVKRLDNGNTVVLFGMLESHSQSTGPLTVVEVDEAGSVRWRLSPGAAMTRLYRATPLSSVMGEVPGTFH